MVTDTITGIITFGICTILFFVAIEVYQTFKANRKAKAKRNKETQELMKRKQAANWKVMKEGVKDERHYTTTIYLVRGIYKSSPSKMVSRKA